uniref:Uncharacterized protein n=1 Tax=Amphiprion ocellaris TaxID=80972 RepID=A0AAQ5WY73_AMPOC
MKRPDLGIDGEYDGWQAVDPTPQELSDESGEMLKVDSDTKRVGKKISTKAVGSRRRQNITKSYKHKEGISHSVVHAVPQWKSLCLIQFIALWSLTVYSDARPLSIHISVQAMNHNGRPTGKILAEDKEETLLPGKGDSSSGEMLAFRSKHLRVWPKLSACLDSVNLHHFPVSSSSFLIIVCVTCRIQDLNPNDTMSIKFDFTPYKKGEKTLTADFDCDTFRDIKAICTVNVV